MRENVVVAAGILVAGLLLAVWLYTERMEHATYDVAGSSTGAYLVNRTSGEVWFLVANKKIAVAP